MGAEGYLHRVPMLLLNEGLSNLYVVNPSTFHIEHLTGMLGLSHSYSEPMVILIADEMVSGRDCEVDMFGTGLVC